MTKRGERSAAGGGAEERKARLARALRENMRKRKAQARGRQAVEANGAENGADPALRPEPDSQGD